MKKFSVFEKNYNKYTEQKDNILTVGLGADGLIYAEMTSSTGNPFLCRINPGTLVVDHHCMAIEKGTPCWHLAALIDFARGFNRREEVAVSGVIPDYNTVRIVKDLTEEKLGRKGRFELLKPVYETEMEEVSPETIDLPDEDRWLARYNFPPRILKRVLDFRAKQRERLTPEQLSRVPEANYIPSGEEIIRAVGNMTCSSWVAPLLIGPKGSGKSTMAETLAAILMLPVRKIFGGIDLSAEALLGSKTLEPQEGVDLITETKLRAAAKAAGIDAEPLVQKLKGAQLKIGFEPGILLSAVLNGELVVVDEVNMLIPEVTSLLHGLLDWQKTLSVPGYGEVKAPESFRLIACMNYGYAGTKPLNEAFQDRFRSIYVPHLTKENLTSLIQDKTGVKREIARKLSELFQLLSDRVKNGDISDRSLSVRALFVVAEEYMDGSNLKGAAISVLTEGLGDKYEIEQVTDICQSLLA